MFLFAFAVGGRPGAGLAAAGALTTTTGLWATWAYAWALVAPGAVGLGLFVYGVLTGQRDLVVSGGWALLTGLGLFIVFAFFFESVIGLSGERIVGLDALLAAGLVLLGAAIVGVSLASGRRREG